MEGKPANKLSLLEAQDIIKKSGIHFTLEVKLLELTYIIY